MTTSPPTIDPPAPETRTGRRIGRGVIITAVIILAALVGGIWYFFIRDDAPPAFSIDDATSALDDPADAGSSTEGADGTWVVNPEVAAAESPLSAGFRVQEELASIGANTVVGRTDDVTGELVIDGTTVSSVSVTVGMDTLATDDSRRDGRMRDALDTDQFPTATFELREPIELDEIPEPGEAVSTTATGDMTIHGVTRSVGINLDAELVGDTLVVVGSTPVTFADYDVQTPSSQLVLSVDDDGTIEFQLYLTKA